MPRFGIVDAAGGDGLLPWSWAVERLPKNNYFLTTVRNDGRPHSRPTLGRMDGTPNCVPCPGADDAVIMQGAAKKRRVRPF